MQTTILICAIIAALFSLLAFGVAVAGYTLLKSHNEDTWESDVAIDVLTRDVRKLFRFVKDEYQRAAAANGMFREQTAEAKLNLANHMANCHAEDLKPEDTPAFTELIKEEATHKLADFFEAVGLSPDEIAAATDTVQGEVTQILETGTLIAESGPEEIFADEEFDFEHPTRGYEDVELPEEDSTPMALLNENQDVTEVRP